MLDIVLHVNLAVSVRALTSQQGVVRFSGISLFHITLIFYICGGPEQLLSMVRNSAFATDYHLHGVSRLTVKIKRYECVICNNFLRFAMQRSLRFRKTHSKVVASHRQRMQFGKRMCI